MNMKRLVIPAVAVALIIAGVFWYRHEQYKACVRLQMALTFDFRLAQDRCDRQQLLGE